LSAGGITRRDRPWRRRDHPDRGTRRRREHHIEGPVFNDYAFGGYLIFAGIKPFIDGRYFYGDAFIKRYAEAVSVASDELPRLLAEYHIAWTLLGAKTPAVVLLDHLPGWRRLYADEVAVCTSASRRRQPEPNASRNQKL